MLLLCGNAVDIIFISTWFYMVRAKRFDRRKKEKMSDYVITTDSNSDVLPEFIKENDLTIIPQYYSFGDTVYGDELNMPPHEFYETMRKGELPKSQANNPAVIRERF